MKRQTFSVMFYLRRARTSKKGYAPIQARITTNGISKDINIQCSVPPEIWDSEKEGAIGKSPLSHQINSYLMDYRIKILDIRRELLAKGYEGNAIEIKEKLLNKSQSARMLLDEFSKYCEKRQKEVGINITQLTANKYHRLLRYMKEYVREKYLQDDILLSAVNYEFIDGLNVYIQTAHKCHHNGAVNLLSRLKNFILYALRNDWIDKNPFVNYKLSEKQFKQKAILEKFELDAIINKPMPNDRLDRIRDVFVFACFTGLSFSDLAHLRDEHITTDQNGIKWIHKPREKTAIISSVPLLSYPLELLEKYKKKGLNRGLLLPIPSNQKMNAYLHEIATICNINKHLTTHCARHSFATLAVEYGMPIDVLAKILGHSDTNMTRHYAKFSRQLIGREMLKLGQALTTKTNSIQ